MSTTRWRRVEDLFDNAKRLDPAQRRDALGARVEIRLTSGRMLRRRVRSDGSYASANDPRVLVGLGGGGVVDRVRIRWPDGSLETWRDLPTETYSTLRRGHSEVAPR